MRLSLESVLLVVVLFFCICGGCRACVFVFVFLVTLVVVFLVVGMVVVVDGCCGGCGGGCHLERGRSKRHAAQPQSLNGRSQLEKR